MKMKLLAALVPSVLFAGLASAGPVIGTGQGSFTSLSSCDFTGSDRDCRIVSTAANGSATQVQWGSQHRTNDFVNPSTLTAVDLSINTVTNAYGVRLARLDWYNSATLRLNNSLDSFEVDWKMRVDFTTPSGPDAHGAETFDLTIKNPINPTGDSIYGFQLADLSHFASTFRLSGITVSGFRYQVVDGAGSGNSFLGVSSGKTYWYNDEYNHASLYVLADFTSPTTPPSPIPEPETYAMMLAGLGLLGLAGRRRKQKEAAAK